jgi:hypothetical protein
LRALAAQLIARLDAAGAEGPPHAYVWANASAFAAAVSASCEASLQSGSTQPVDF